MKGSIGAWGTGPTPGGNDRYLLVRQNPDGTLSRISFTGGIINRMGIEEYEWKPVQGTVEQEFDGNAKPKTNATKSKG